MKRLPFTLILIAFSTALVAAGTKKYRGAWFEVHYPANFKIQNSLQSSGMPHEFDSAFFASPDGKVRFYIFSPQWAGETPDIAWKPAFETEKTDKTETSNGFKKRWFTFTPRKSGFTRSYVETKNEEETVRWVIGIEYADKKSYDKYQSAYLKFKQSLKQFAD
jgi:hypothetical protein